MVAVIVSEAFRGKTAAISTSETKAINVDFNRSNKSFHYEFTEQS
jgi:hypothetical protein